MYNNYQYPNYQNAPNFAYNASFQSRNEIVHVNGKNGADALKMPPNGSMLLLDESEPLVWLAQTDGAGYKTLTPYKIEPYKEEVQPTQNDLYLSLESRIQKLEESINDSQSNVTSTRKKSFSSLTQRRRLSQTQTLSLQRYARKAT